MFNLDYAFLKTLDVRFKQNSIGYYLQSYAMLNKKDYRRNVLSDEDFYMLMYLTLLFIDEKTLISENCFSDDIRSFLNEICKSKSIIINQEELIADIINNCFQFGGKTQESFNSLFLDKNINIEILKTDLINDKYSYYLSENCRIWLYSSHEIEEISEISLNTMLINKQISLGKFSQAKNQARELLRLVELRIRETKTLRLEILTNIEDASCSEINKTINKNLDLIMQQQKEINDINEQIKRLKNKDFSNTDVNPIKIQEGIADINATIKILDNVITKQIELHNELFDIRNTFDEELINFSFLNGKDYVNISRDILEKLRSYKSIVFPLEELIVPMLGFDKIKIFNPTNIIQEQSIITPNEDDGIFQEKCDDIKEEIDPNIEKTNEIYRSLFYIIVKELIKKHEVYLSDIFKNNKLMKQHLSELKTILVILTTNQNGKIQFVPKQFFNHIDTLTLKFEPEYIHNYYKDLEGIEDKFIVSTFTEQSIILEGCIKDNIQDVIKTNDIKFILEEQ